VLSAPGVTTHSGQRAVIEIIREFRYPTEWEPGTSSMALKGPTTPKAFETRNCGSRSMSSLLANEDGNRGVEAHATGVGVPRFRRSKQAKAIPFGGKRLSLSNRTVGESNPTFPIARLGMR